MPKKLHIICGMCGSNEMLSFKISTEIDDDTDKEKSVVYVYCENCSTVTDLSETIKEDNE